MPGDKPANQFTRAGMGILKRLVFDGATIEPDERRHQDREPVAGEVDVRVIDEAGREVGRTRVFIRDLSKGGCGLWSRVAIPAGYRVVVSFPPVGSGVPVVKSGQVCHCRGQAGSGFAVGVRFTGDGVE